MGYSYTQAGKLCCDICGEPGARKYPCPFGWCQAIAACAACRKSKAEIFTKAGHREHGCEKCHNEFQDRLAARSATITAGGFCLKAALSVWENKTDTGIVHVIFEGANNVYQGRFMPKDVYHFQTGNETIEYFEQRHGGPLPVAPVDFHTKQVSPAELFASLPQSTESE